MLYASGGEQKSINGVVTDSRAVRSGDLFVALRGERADGHQFAGQAAAAGASALLVENSADSLVEGGWRGFAAEKQVDIIAVEDALKALQQLGREWLERFPDMIRIAVTGSSGKTSTKELLGSVLGSFAPSVVNEGNLNSEIGLPLALFAIRDEDRFGIFELGINRKGEMDLLASLFRPDYVLITSIGTAHSGPLGGKEGIFHEKSRIFAHMKKGGAAFIPSDENRINRLREMYPDVRFISYGPSTIPELGKSESLGTEGWLLKYKEREIHFPLLGEHNLRNACGVLALCGELSVGTDAIAKGLSECVPVPGRTSLIRGSVSILDDSYNANLDSTRKVLEYISTLPWDGRRIVVFGSMKELGESTESAHYEAGRVIASAGADAVFLFGAETGAAGRALEAAGFSGELHNFGDDGFEELASSLQRYCRPGDLVLLKGSRTMGLDRLVGCLRKNGE
jgi:UDP-N-acetylmuramoyl-tripeptide--D-alanyl-D-alanine ligase